MDPISRILCALPASVAAACIVFGSLACMAGFAMLEWAIISLAKGV